MATSKVEVRKRLQPQTLSKYNYIWIKLDSEVQKRWSLNKIHFELGWTKFKVEEVIKKLDPEQILEERCVQYLMNSAASSKIQVHINQDQAWEIPDLIKVFSWEQLSRVALLYQKLGINIHGQTQYFSDKDSKDYGKIWSCCNAFSPVKETKRSWSYISYPFTHTLVSKKVWRWVRSL